MKICTTCNGSGKVDDGLDGPNRPCFVDCEVCSGTGKAPERPRPPPFMIASVDHIAQLGDIIEKASDFVGRVCQHYEGDPLPSEHEAKELDALLARALRPTSAIPPEKK